MPLEVSEMFTTAVDGQTDIIVKIAQGESPIFNNNKILGQFKLSNLTPKGKGKQKIHIKFKVDSNGILKVYGESEGIEKMIEINESEILMTKKEAESYNKKYSVNKERDLEKAKFMELKQNCIILINEVEQILKQNKGIGKLKEINIKNNIKELKKMIKKEKPCNLKINKKLEDLNIMKDKLLLNIIN